MPKQEIDNHLQSPPWEALQQYYAPVISGYVQPAERRRPTALIAALAVAVVIAIWVST